MRKRRVGNARQGAEAEKEEGAGKGHAKAQRTQSFARRNRVPRRKTQGAAEGATKFFAHLIDFDHWDCEAAEGSRGGGVRRGADRELSERTARKILAGSNGSDH
jgi:hypothetical protein